ncbi:MAG: ABC transporter substrate-binding protein [Alphaproteobacteria bacterium]
MKKYVRNFLVPFATASMIAVGGASAAEMTVATASMPRSLANPLGDASHSGRWLFQLAFDPVTYGADTGTVPGLAVSWKNISPTTWELKVRQGVTFHDGKALHASDIADLINWLNTDEGKAKGINTLRNMSNIIAARVIDDATLEVSTKTPDPMVPPLLGGLYVVNMKLFNDVGYDGITTNPIGTGAYKSVSWQKDVIEVTPHTAGWRVGKIDKLVVRELPEVAARMSAFESKQVDLAIEVSPETRSRVEAAGGKLVVSSTPQNINLMFFQNRPGTPLHDVRVRQALNYAVNKQAFVDAILGGLSVPAGQPAARTVNGYNPDVAAYPYDPAKARQLLAEAGYGDGLELLAEAVVNVAERREIYSQVALDAAKVGVKITINEITLPDLIGKVRDSTKMAPLFGFNYGSEPTMDVMRSINALHSCNTATKWTCFPEIEPTIKAANEEFDENKRREMLKQINKHYHDQASAIFLYEEVQIDAVSNKVSGYAPKNRVINWHDLSIGG